MKNDEFEAIHKDMHLSRQIYERLHEMLKSLQMDDVFGSILDVLVQVKDVGRFEDSIRCVTAITHDLGYPLKKIEKINKCIKNVLPYFSINDYDEFNFNYSNLEQNFIHSFVEFLSESFNGSSEAEGEQYDNVIKKVFDLNKHGNILDIRKEEVLKLTEEELSLLKKALIMKVKIEKNKSAFWAYSKDFEEYKHGIMSAFLLTKNVKAFNAIKYSYSSEWIEFKQIDYADLVAKQMILKAVTDHTSEGFQIESINESSTFLTFIDELEEFSRISRANQNREYISEFCKTNIYMKDSYLNIDFTFDNKQIDNLDPERAFKGRCERFLNLFRISSLSENLKLRLRCIGELEYDKNIYTLEVGRKYAKIMVNDEEKDIPSYLKSKQFYSREEYTAL